MDRALEILAQGGPTMVPLLLCSVLALAAAVDRAWSLARRRVLPAPLVAAARRFRPGDPETGERALLETAREHPGPLADVLAAAVEDPPPERELAVERVQAAGRRAVRQLDRGLLLLEIVAGISPLLGLFGTVLGMFETFQVIAREGLGDPASLSGGISEALVTTIFGLGIAIPAVVAQGYFSKRVEDLVLDIEELGGGVLARLYPGGEGAAVRAAAPAGPAETAAPAVGAALAAHGGSREAAEGPAGGQGRRGSGGEGVP